MTWVGFWDAVKQIKVIRRLQSGKPWTREEINEMAIERQKRDALRNPK